MIKRITDYINTKKSLINTFKQKVEYLYPGKYILSNSLTYIYHNDRINKYRAYAMFKKNYIKPIVRAALFLFKICFFRNMIIIQSDNNKLGGAVCSIGIDKISGKIFDFENKKILTFFTGPDEYKAAINNYEIFKGYLNTPKLLDHNSDELIIVEELIESKSNNSWTTDDYIYVMKDVLICSYKYLDHVKSLKAYTLMRPYSFIKHDKRLDWISNYIEYNTDPYILSMQFPFAKLHGDMWTPNILLKESNGQIFYIDFEFSEDLIFFYDIFWLMLEQAFFHGNHIYFDNYFKGEYDSCFKWMFRIFDLTYDIRFKFDYLNIFFLNCSAQRLSGINRAHRLIYFLKYKRLIKRLKRLYGSI